MTLYTIGYEGLDIEEFCDFVKKNKIKLIADLRKNPVSRKRGFSKRLLGENLEKYSVEYFHFGGLGVPTEWRKKAKEEIITRKKMFRDYVKKVLPLHQEEISQIQKLMKSKNLALLCYEADAADCHRSFVAEEISKREQKKLTVKDLIVTQKKGLFKKPIAESKSK